MTSADFLLCHVDGCTCLVDLTTAEEGRPFLPLCTECTAYLTEDEKGLIYYRPEHGSLDRWSLRTFLILGIAAGERAFAAEEEARAT